MSLSPSIQTEAATAAYLFANRGATPAPLAPCNVYAGALGRCEGSGFRLRETPSGANEDAVHIEYPALMVGAAEMKELVYGCGIFEGKLAVRVETQLDDDTDTAGQNAHGARLAAARALLEDFAGMSAAVNKPASGTDSRPVKDFTLSAIVYREEIPEFADRRISTTLVYYVCVCPADPA